MEVIARTHTRLSGQLSRGGLESRDATSIFLAQLASITKREPESATPGSVCTKPRAATCERLELEKDCHVMVRPTAYVAALRCASMPRYTLPTKLGSPLAAFIVCRM